MPDLPPPPPSPEKDQEQENLVVAQLIQIAMTCLRASKSTPDPRVERLKEASMKELRDSGGLEILLSIMSQSQSSSNQQEQSRAAEREQLKQTFQQSMLERQQANQAQRNQLAELEKQLMNQLITKLSTTK